MRTSYDISEEIKDIFNSYFVEGYELSESQYSENEEGFRQQIEWLLEEWEKEKETKSC